MAFIATFAAASALSLPRLALADPTGQLRGVIGENVGPQEMKTSARALEESSDSCTDTADWDNGYWQCWSSEGRREGDGCTPQGWTCEGYSIQGWCRNGEQVPQWESGVYAFGPTLNYPERNCCDCGGGLRSGPEGYVVSPVNCYGDHGADEIDTPFTAPKDMTEESCAARCNLDSLCTCFVLSSDEGKCFKRANCDVNACANGDGVYNTYIKTAPTPPTPPPTPSPPPPPTPSPTPSPPTPPPTMPVGYRMYEANCYEGHGATDIDTDSTAPADMDASSCAARCEADSSCTCFVLATANGQCYKRADCDLYQCDAGEGQFQTYIKWH